MIPLKDRNPTHRFPFVTISLIAVNIMAWLYQVSLGEQQWEQFFRDFGLVPAAFVHAISESTEWAALIPLGTSLFLHGGWLHVLGNMLYLWVFGDNVEDKLGHLRFFVFYVFCGVIASAIHIFADPGSTIPTVGASGAISGVLGAYLLLFPKARVLTLIPIFVFIQVAELPAIVVLGIWFILQFLNGMVSIGLGTAGMGGVAWWAHIGGFVAGMLLVVPLRKFR